MRTFTVTAHSVIVGFRVHMGPFPHVRMGNIEEHQTALHLPIARDEWRNPPRHIKQCGWRWVQPRKKERTDMQLLLTPEKKSNSKRSNHALVLVDIRGKEGGTAAWTTARKSTHTCPLTQSNGGTLVQCPLCWGEYVRGHHPPRGEYFDYGPFPIPGVGIVKKGHIRYTGSHPVYPNNNTPEWAQVMLLDMEPGAIFRVHRGYEKGIANERFVRWNGSHIELGTHEELLDKHLIVEERPTTADPTLGTQVG
ncbi:hypothetical protein LCGC14_1753660 [marine sediment metagenome]|uniref:Uncharacterized protein n=1 Tax=marine sediment metagenome TaxID=412755 RepID=A0A0F9HQI5_9ZZZZ